MLAALYYGSNANWTMAPGRLIALVMGDANHHITKYLDRFSEILRI